MAASDSYQVYAVKYGSKQDRFRHENFIMADAHDEPMPLDIAVMG